MSAGFTRGPWVAELTDTPYAELGESWVIDAPDTGAICTLDCASDEREANARLIAAAPELYEALEQTNAFLGDALFAPMDPLLRIERMTELFQQVEAATAKARGEQ